MMISASRCDGKAPLRMVRQRNCPAPMRAAQQRKCIVAIGVGNATNSDETKEKALSGLVHRTGQRNESHHKILCSCGYYTAEERKRQDAKATTVNATAK